MNGWAYYGTRDLQVVPYMVGSPVYRDGVLSVLYNATKEENKLAQTFCGDVMNHDEFVAFFQKRKTMQVLCRVEGNRDLKPVGYSWVDLARGVDGARAVMCGFCFFRRAIWRHAALDLARLGLAYWFMDLKIDVLHGVMLSSNRVAIRFAESLGFEWVARVPNYHFHEGKLVEATVTMIQKESFLPDFEAWFERQPKPQAE